MKSFRAGLIYFLVALGIWILAGCASTSRDSNANAQTSPVDGMEGIVKQKPSPTDDLNPAEKTGYYLGWLSLAFLYGLAGGNPPFFPP